MESLPRALPYNLLRTQVCNSCLRSLRREGTLGTARLRHSRQKSYIAGAGEQANPLSGYYAELLNQPLHITASATRTPAIPSPPESLPKTEQEERIAKARLVFGSRLAGPIERRKKIEEQSTRIGGILVPPRPQEPDNCCMSGCVNCVWDLYRDDLEEWAAQSKLAREALAKQKQEKERDKKKVKRIPSQDVVGVGTGSMVAQPGVPTHVATSMDDDGGGSDTNWSPPPQEDLFGGIPVGIREFMKTEKMLKDKHRAEGTRYSY